MVSMQLCPGTNTHLVTHREKRKREKWNEMHPSDKEYLDIAVKVLTAKIW